MVGTVPADVATAELPLGQARPAPARQNLPMPIWLEPDDCLTSRTAGRLVFVVDLENRGGANEVLTLLRTVPGVTVLDPPSDLLEEGLVAILGNYLTGQQVGGGMSALAEPRPFLLAVRALADAVYAAARDRIGGEVLVDASPSMALSPHLLPAVYPDALVVVIDDPASDGSLSRLLVGPRVCRVTREQVARDPAAATAVLTRDIASMRAEMSAPLSEPPRAPARVEDGRQIFVVGVPRSGTTWLQNLLSAHHAIDGPAQETAIFTSLEPLWANAAVLRWIDRAALRVALREFCDTLFVECLSAKGSPATWVIEKTPLHGMHLELITTIYPDAWIVGIVRDGRDVSRSLVELSFGVEEVAIAARAWALVTSEIERVAPTLKHFRRVRYEEVLERPTAMTAELLSWVGLAPDDATKREITHRVTERVSRYNTSGEVGAGKWKDMPAAQLRTIYRYAGDRLVETGYMTAAELAAARSGVAYRVDQLVSSLKALVSRRPHAGD